MSFLITQLAETQHEKKFCNFLLNQVPSWWKTEMPKSCRKRSNFESNRGSNYHLALTNQQPVPLCEKFSTAHYFSNFLGSQFSCPPRGKRGIRYAVALKRHSLASLYFCCVGIYHPSLHSSFCPPIHAPVLFFSPAHKTSGNFKQLCCPVLLLRWKKCRDGWLYHGASASQLVLCTANFCYQN